MIEGEKVATMVVIVEVAESVAVNIKAAAKMVVILEPTTDIAVINYHKLSSANIIHTETSLPALDSYITTPK